MCFLSALYSKWLWSQHLI
uniref:Uncharacterized protein n=1 Tax=Rhizophora mucronata TaxID=61149 RepID=A0A2P2PJZ6_RHIMU